METILMDICGSLKEVTMEDLRQVLPSKDTLTPHTPTLKNENMEDKPKKKKNRNKEKRRKRLLKFHKKLVKTSGPGSRIFGICQCH